MKFRILILLLFTITQQLKCQADTNIYSSSFEKEIFQHLADSISINELDLFLAIDYKDSHENIEERIGKFIDNIGPQLSKQKSLKKKLKTIYKSMQSEFFTSYEEEVYFSEIFISGKYNNVTATALYSLILHKLEIDYIIKENPTQVYMIADPAETSYLFESSMPDDGLKQYSSKYQKDFVDYLHKNKIISDSEFRNSSIAALFSEHFSNEKTITIKELAGIQYYNDGVYKYDKEQYEEALLCLLKARDLYSANNINFMLNISLSYVMDNEYNSKKYNPYTLRRYFELNKNDENSMQNGLRFFNDISKELIIEQSAYEEYKKYFEMLNEDDLDTIYRKQLTDIYKQLTAYYHYSNNNYYSALKNLSVSYNLNPKNAQTKQLILNASSKYLSKISDKEQMLDSLNHYFQVFPFIKKDKHIGNLGVYCYSDLISKSFREKKFSEGNKYIEELENFVNNIPEFKANENNITFAFAQAASVYVQNQEYGKAEDIIKKGLALAPSSNELKGRLQTIEKFNTGGVN